MTSKHIIMCAILCFDWNIANPRFMKKKHANEKNDMAAINNMKDGQIIKNPIKN